MKGCLAFLDRKNSLQFVEGFPYDIIDLFITHAIGKPYLSARDSFKKIFSQDCLVIRAESLQNRVYLQRSAVIEQIFE